MRQQSGWWAATALLALAAPAAGQAWRADPAGSGLTLITVGPAATHAWRFSRFDALIAWDAVDVAGSRFDLIIDVASLVTQGGGNVRAALGPRCLDAAAFPRAYFVTTRFRRSAAGRVVAEGELKLRGVARPATFAVDFASHGAGTTLDINTALAPRDFGIGSSGECDAFPAGVRLTLRGHLALRRAR